MPLGKIPGFATNKPLWGIQWTRLLSDYSSLGPFTARFFRVTRVVGGPGSKWNDTVDHVWKPGIEID
jgi:hypothetical protein